MTAPAATQEVPPAPPGAAAREAVARASGLLISLCFVLLIVLACLALKINVFSVLIAGLTLGSVYAVVALGYTLVYGIIELINFAHGDVFAFGAFASLALLEKMDANMADVNSQFNDSTHTINLLGLHFHVGVIPLAVGTVLLSMLFAAVICAFLGAVVERIAYRPLRNAPRLAPLITAIGASFIIENGLLQWRGGSNVSYPSITPLNHYTAFGSLFANVDIIVIVTAIVLMIVLDRFVNRSKLGKAMRAVAQDREAALMMGISVNSIIVVTFIVGSALAGAGSVVYGMELGSIGYNMGFTLGLYAFTAAVLGGIGNIRGAMVGGLLLGFVQQFINQTGNGGGTAFSDPAVFAVLVLILVFRPSGLLGAQIPEKV